MEAANTIIVANRKSVADMRREGGCGYWPIGDDTGFLNAKGFRYVVCLLNDKNSQHHRKPYFFAEIAGEPELSRGSCCDLKSRKTHKGRQLLKLGQCSRIDPENFREWNPLPQSPIYRPLSDLACIEKSGQGIVVSTLQLVDLDALDPA